MAVMVIGFLVMSLLVGPSFSQASTDTTTGAAWPASTLINNQPTTTGGIAAQSTTLSEYDTVNKVYYQLTYCDYIGYGSKCDAYQSTLRIALDHRAYGNICSAARNLINCMDISCRSSSDREDANRQVIARCSVSEDERIQIVHDKIESVWYKLTYCNYLGYSGRCSPFQSTLRIALDHKSTEMCSAARNLINCLDMHCHNDSGREDAIQQVRAQCTESDKTAAQNAIQNEVITLTRCTFIFDFDNCGREYRDFSTSLNQYNYDIIEICTLSYVYMTCLEQKCAQSWDLNQSIARVRTECGRFVNETSTQFTTPTVVTPSVSEPDALTSEWLTLTSCSFKETTETCTREKYTLEFSRALRFEICRNAYIFLECLEDRCQYSKELTRSIMKTRADCNATNKKLSQSNVVINNYIGGVAESRRAKNILEILGIYPDN